MTRVPGRDGLALAHLGPGANHAPVAEHLRREFAAETERARQEDDELLRQSGGSHELGGVHCDDRGEAIRAEDDAVENLRMRRGASRRVLQEGNEMTCGRASSAGAGTIE
jgi:hypothetical protein